MGRWISDPTASFLSQRDRPSRIQRLMSGRTALGLAQPNSARPNQTVLSLADCGPVWMLLFFPYLRRCLSLRVRVRGRAEAMSCPNSYVLTRIKCSQCFSPEVLFPCKLSLPLRPCRAMDRLVGSAHHGRIPVFMANPCGYISPLGSPVASFTHFSSPTSFWKLK